MDDLKDLGMKLGITSPRVLRKAKEYCQLVDIRGKGGCLSALNLTGSSKTVTCLELAACTCGHSLDKASAVRVAGMTKKTYTMALKTIESILEVQEVRSVQDLAIQFGCTGAITLAKQVLKKYAEEHRARGDDLDFNTSLFQGTALCAACKKLKMRVDKGKVKEMCAVKRSCFDTLLTEMDKIADQIKSAEVHMASKKRGSTFLDEVERKLQEEVPEKKLKDEEEEETVENRDYEAWKRHTGERCKSQSQDEVLITLNRSMISP